MNTIIKKKKRNLSIAGPFQKWKGTLTLNLQHSFPISLCVGVHECMPGLTSISSSLWEENSFNTGGYVYSRILEGSGCSICRNMRCAAEPGWGRWCLGMGRRGERKMEIHASRTLFFFFLLPIMLQRGLIYASHQFIICICILFLSFEERLCNLENS